MKYNKNKIIIIIIAGFILCMIGFMSFSVLGFLTSFIGGIMLYGSVFYIGLYLKNKRKILSKILILLSSLAIIGFVIVTCVMIKFLLSR